jgi:hypothetical protein
MARSTRKKQDGDDVPLALGRRLYRMFLLSILFGVLWVKQYLWTAFVFALLLYVLDTIVLPALAMEAARVADPEPPSRPERSRWKWTPEDTP